MSLMHPEFENHYSESWDKLSPLLLGLWPKTLETLVKP